MNVPEHHTNTTQAPDPSSLAQAVAWVVSQEGLDVLAHAQQLRAALAKAPAHAPELRVLERNLDDGFLGPFANAYAHSEAPSDEALARASAQAARYLTNQCFIDQLMAHTISQQFAQGIRAGRAASRVKEEALAGATMPAPKPETSPQPSEPVGMKTYAPATAERDTLATFIGRITRGIGERNPRVLVPGLAAVLLAGFLLFSRFSPTKAHLTFDGNGATGGITMSITADQGSTVELPLCGFRRDGYEFVGWYNESTHELLLAQSLVEAHGKTNYMAEWAPIVSFDGNGAASGSLPTMTVTRGSEITLPKNVFVRASYDFLGWAVAGHEDQRSQPGETLTISGPTTIVATWGHTLTFKGNGATKGSVDPIQVLGTGNATLPENGFGYPGHKFAGWAQDVGENKPAKPGQEIVVKQSLVFHAIWRCRARFEGNGATAGATKSLFAKTSGKLVLPECGYTREGYRFVGWVDSANVPSQDEKDSAQPAEQPPLLQPGETVLLSTPTTFVAWWEQQ